ncbi:expressed unknown protein [Seminavis robusta]|uniref:CRAL-TRIO domain-containing protein n=1 Tax=Seminavis robusta TaxID=568900 RepID=A0A9N8DEM0_9STRA|nr:expressed unknown protein [Seminavis robusta]|eukprot:Sro53_g031450.1 n/a (441) ;mRNA; f:90956-92370
MASRLRRSFRRRSSNTGTINGSSEQKQKHETNGGCSTETNDAHAHNELELPSTAATPQEPRLNLSRPPTVRRVTSGTLRKDDSIRLDYDYDYDYDVPAGTYKQCDCGSDGSDEEEDPGLESSSISSLEGDQQKQQPATSRSKRDPEARKVQEIFATLSDMDRETAARTSWKYYNEVGQRDNVIDIRRRDALARAMIQRHLAQEGGDTAATIKSVHATLQGRRDEKLDWLRTAWHPAPTWSPERQEFSQMVRATMSRWLGPHGRVCILDYDDEDRCNFYHKLNISTSGTRYFREGVLYSASFMLEKAIACSERRSHGRQTQVNVVLDFREVNMRDKDKTLPISIALELVDLMKNHNPQRLYTVYMIDAPFLARFAWPIFRPFVNHIVQGGIKFVTGKRQIIKVFGAKMLHYDRASNLDMDKFYQLPFDQAYEDVHGSALEY